MDNEFVSQIVESFRALVQQILTGSIVAMLIGIVELWILLVVYRTLRMIVRLAREIPNSFRNRRFSIEREGATMRILIVGDSTACGTGASAPEDTIAGRLAHDFPSASIVNKGRNGSTTREVLAQLQSAGSTSFDLVLISTGGNDIWRFTRYRKIEMALRSALMKATGMSGHRVVVLFYGNMGRAPIFPAFIRAVLEHRSERLHELFLRVCDESQVLCVDFYTDTSANMFHTFSLREEYYRYFASDFMHPSSEGYRVWYNRMWREMVTHGYTLHTKSPPTPNLPQSGDAV